MKKSYKKCLIFFAIQQNNYNLIDFLLKKKIELPEIYFYVEPKFNYDVSKDLNHFLYNHFYDMYLDVFNFINGFKSYELIKKYDSTKIKSTMSFNLKLVANCIRYLINPPMKEKQTDERIDDTLDLLLVLFEFIDSLNATLSKDILKEHLIHKNSSYNILILRKMNKYIDWKCFLKIICFDSYKHSVKYYPIISENYGRYKDDILANIKKENIVFFAYSDLIIKIDGQDLYMSTSVYFPFIFDLLSNNLITTNIMIKYIFMTDNLIKEHIDRVLEYFRQNNNRDLYFSKSYFIKGNNLIMEFLPSKILLKYKNMEDTEQKQFLRLFGFLLKNIFKSPIYTNSTFLLEKNKFVNFLSTIIHDMLKVYKMENIKEIKEIYFRMKVVITILETHQAYLDTLTTLKDKDSKNFLDNSNIKESFRGFLGVDFIIASEKDPILKRLKYLVFRLP
jgi:hypothetical protein